MKQLVKLKLGIGHTVTTEEREVIANAYEIAYKQARDNKPFDRNKQIKWRINITNMCQGMLNVLQSILQTIDGEKDEEQLIYNGLFYDSYRNLREICLNTGDNDIGSEFKCHCGKYTKRGKYLDQLIVTWYIREMNDITIPKDIHRLCFMFYYGCNKIFYSLDDEEVNIKSQQYQPKV